MLSVHDQMKGEYLAATSQFHLAISMKPDMSSAWFNLGIAYAELGQEDNAITAYQVLLLLTPRSPL